MNVETGKLIGRISEVEWLDGGMMEVVCRMGDGSRVTFERIPDTRLGSQTTVEITYRFETPEAHQ